MAAVPVNQDRTSASTHELNSNRRFIRAEQRVAELANLASDLSPMRAPNSLNLDAVAKQIDDMVKAHLDP
jgi:hypothetical protein